MLVHYNFLKFFFFFFQLKYLLYEVFIYGQIQLLILSFRAKSTYYSKTYVQILLFFLEPHQLCHVANNGLKIWLSASTAPRTIFSTLLANPHLRLTRNSTTNSYTYKHIYYITLLTYPTDMHFSAIGTSLTSKICSY